MEQLKIWLAAIALVFFSGAVGFTTGEAYWRPPTPRFQTSNFSAITEMLRLAGVKPGDVVADLGCGDGRVVIEAAVKHHAFGVCVEHDQQLLFDARANARIAGVEEKIAFVHGDVMDTDLRHVDVVTLFLSRDLNNRLKPKLQRELRSGSRVVSLQHDIDNWTPVEVTAAKQGDGLLPLRMWVVQ